MKTEFNKHIENIQKNIPTKSSDEDRKIAKSILSFSMFYFAVMHYIYIGRDS